MRPRTRRELEAALEAVPRHPAPKPELEQYRTPAGIAAQFVWAAHEEGDLGGRVVDLGCGTGMLGIGAALLGARVLGVDVDGEAVRLAGEVSRELGLASRTEWVAADVAAWAAVPADTVLMNPPFGAQGGNRHADRLFVERAAECVRPNGGAVWFLAQVRTERFLEEHAKRLEARVERVAAWDYPLEAQFSFHTEEVRMVRVGAYRLSWP